MMKLPSLFYLGGVINGHYALYTSVTQNIDNAGCIVLQKVTLLPHGVVCCYVPLRYRKSVVRVGVYLCDQRDMPAI